MYVNQALNTRSSADFTRFTVPLSVFITLGTQKDILTAWKIYRNDDFEDRVQASQVHEATVTIQVNK
ncbi:hypothetical protein BJ165DRAFT_1517186 [Panaeolus papilionaceus]|nr:hypothetical protein BJ165DRAFT_1517186 [Panaeolus papilionaceus]